MKLFLIVLIIGTSVRWHMTEYTLEKARQNIEYNEPHNMFQACGFNPCEYKIYEIDTEKNLIHEREIENDTP